MHVVIFEDSHWPALAPFSLSRPAFSLVGGTTTLLQKQIRHLRPTRLTLWVRPQMQCYCLERVVPATGVPTQVNTPLDHEPALLVNARCLLSETPMPHSEEGVSAAAEIVMSAVATKPALASSDALSNSTRWQDLLKLPAMPALGRMIESPVDLIYLNDQCLMADFSHREHAGVAKPAGPYHLVSDLDVWLGGDVSLSAGCVLDASKGPVIVAAGAAIGPNAVVQGPCYIGPGATVAPLGVIRPGTSIGAMCKVGGEVSVSILLGHSNKGHEGFLGHSYIGKWVNLGAGTTTSNLKNTYGEITLRRGGAEITTGRRFLGSLIGDHAKTAILTRLMGGTYIGFFSMLASSGHAPRFVPSFTFFTDKGPAPYDREKAVEVAQRVFTRRDRAWTDTDQQLMDYVAEAAAAVEA